MLNKVLELLSKKLKVTLKYEGNAISSKIAVSKIPCLQLDEITYEVDGLECNLMSLAGRVKLFKLVESKVLHPVNQELINPSNSCPVEVNGIQYTSITEAYLSEINYYKNVLTNNFGIPSYVCELQNITGELTSRTPVKQLLTMLANQYMTDLVYSELKKAEGLSIVYVTANKELAELGVEKNGSGFRGENLWGKALIEVFANKIETEVNAAMAAMQQQPQQFNVAQQSIESQINNKAQELQLAGLEQYEQQQQPNIQRQELGRRQFHFDFGSR